MTVKFEVQGSVDLNGNIEIGISGHNLSASIGVKGAALGAENGTAAHLTPNIDCRADLANKEGEGATGTSKAGGQATDADHIGQGSRGGEGTESETTFHRRQVTRTKQFSKHDRSDSLPRVDPSVMGRPAPCLSGGVKYNATLLCLLTVPTLLKTVLFLCLT